MSMTIFILLFSFIIGAVIGSFLNVVIYRLPLMLLNHKDDDLEKTEIPDRLAKIMDSTVLASSPKKYFNLAFPFSHCPECHEWIKPWHNIPIISFFMLKGRCSNCKTKISYQYPLVEALSAVFGVFWIGLLGITLKSIFLCLFSWWLIVLLAIDYRYLLLPDQLTLTFLWLGIIANLSGIFVDLHSSVIGAIAGYISLWAFCYLYFIFTGKQGMGYGDFKFFAGLGAWMGWKALIPIILISATVGIFYGITLILMKKQNRHQPIPFGPFLAFGGFFMMLAIEFSWLI